MAWRIVVQPNGLLARFSEIVDDFTHLEMTQAEAVQSMMEEHSMTEAQADAKIYRALAAGISRWDDAIGIILAVHGEERVVEVLRSVREPPKPRALK